MKTKHPLIEVLRSRDDALALQAEHLVAQAIQILPHTLSTFPTGTSHGPEHTTTVEQIAAMLLSNGYLAALSDRELFFLALSCHYHDLGMAGTESDDATPEAREQVRRDHAIRIGEKLRDGWAHLGFANSNDARILGELCRGHRPPKGSDGQALWDELEMYVIVGVGATIRMRLLSAIIYATDELHIGADRAPERSENWRNLQNEESLRHWRRHQAIQGPAPSPTGSLSFEISVKTPGVEADLRQHVLVKALRAYEDLRRQSEAAGIIGPLPGIEIKWDRSELWSLLLPVAIGDLNPRTRVEIESAVLERYRDEEKRALPLEELCEERGNTEEELKAVIRRSIGDAITGAIVVPHKEQGGHYVLSTTEATQQAFAKRMRAGDDLDRLFLGQYRVRWTHRLFQSGYGQAYVNSVVIPSVATAYSVNLASHPSASPVKKILESMPTAARVVMECRPDPGNLVRINLVELAALTGATFDLYDDPELILDRDRRHAYRKLVERVTSKIADGMRLVEELAIISGLTIDQVAAMQIVSDAQQKVLEADNKPDEPVITVSLSQSIPTDGIKTSCIANLMLAGRRAKVPIQFTDAPGHLLEITVSPSGVTPWTDQKPSFMEVGPGQPSALSPVSLQANLDWDQSSLSVRMRVKRFDQEASLQWPLRLSITQPGSGADVLVAGKASISVRWSHITVNDLRKIYSINDANQTNVIGIEVVDDNSDSRLASHFIPVGSSPFECLLPEWVTQDTLESLSVMGDALPVPLFIKAEKLIAVARLPSEEWSAAWRDLMSMVKSDGFETTSVVLGMSYSGLSLADEEFLDCFPGRMSPTARVRPDVSMSQEELDKVLKNPTEPIILKAYYREDMFDLAERIRKWSADTSAPFPLTFDSGEPSSIGFRTAFTTYFLPSVDRSWHKEWPVRFELRPVNQREAWELEVKFWRSIGDTQRAEIIEERLFASREENVSRKSNAGEVSQSDASAV